MDGKSTSCSFWKARKIEWFWRKRKMEVRKRRKRKTV